VRDFTIDIYKELLAELIAFRFSFKTYTEFVRMNAHEKKLLLLRHDVDARKKNSLLFATIQHSFGVKGTYYFRNIPASYDETLIREVASMSHEIGYHYETMDTQKGDVDKAYDEFCRTLEKFRKIAPVTTICMHGSPLSPYDNRSIWDKYDYKTLGLLAEPYFDLDFNKVFYLTDTGRRWDGASVSVRDKAMTGKESTNRAFTERHFRSTTDIISSLKAGDFPNTVMMTFHPQRWSNGYLPWTQELFLQGLKNSVKKVLISRRAA